MLSLSVLCVSYLALAGCDSIKDRFGGAKTAFDGKQALEYVDRKSVV